VITVICYPYYKQLISPSPNQNTVGNRENPLIVHSEFAVSF